MLKSLDRWDDLREYGIESLTGEADALSMRILCDVTDQGRRALCEFFGLPDDTAFQPNWNSRGIGSVLLPYGILEELAAFLLLRAGADVAAVAKCGRVYGLHNEDMEKTPEWQSLIEPRRIYNPMNVPRRGFSAIHQMSGRSA